MRAAAVLKFYKRWGIIATEGTLALLDDAWEVGLFCSTSSSAIVQTIRQYGSAGGWGKRWCSQLAGFRRVVAERCLPISSRPVSPATLSHRVNSHTIESCII
jgi:hypothetical protein